MFRPPTGLDGKAVPPLPPKRQRFFTEPTSNDLARYVEEALKGKGTREQSLQPDHDQIPPLDQAYQPKVLKCQTEDGNVHEVPQELLRTASNSVDACIVSPCKVNAAAPVAREAESRVMVLYTGGTIGMKLKDGAYSPEANYLPKAMRQLPHLNDQVYVDTHFSGVAVPPCVLPPVKGEDRRVLYWVFEYEPLLDSSDMTFDDWIKIANDIYKAYEQYDGFVVLHGTDTLCYTASAMSYMFENLGKSIVLTGAQIPVAEVRSDGRENFIGALIIAANYDIPEVTIYFNNKLFRGNRTSKVDNSALDAFNSPNVPPLATTEINIHVDWDAIYRSNEPKKVSLQTQLNRNVGLLRIFPSVTVECIRAFLQAPMEGVVLQTFGSGNIPSSRHDIVDELRKAVERGLIIVNCSQCSRGQVDCNYATGKILYDIGVIAGSDMTPETALTKLAYVLGKDSLDLEMKKKYMRANLRGELTVAQNRKITFRDDDVIHRLAKFLHVSTSEEMVSLREAMYPPLVCAAANKDDVPLLQHLRDCGAVLTAVDYDKRTALHVAATSGNLESVKFLLKEGVSVHLRDHNDETPLLSAVRRGHTEIVRVLMEAGAHLTVPPHAMAVELCLLVSKCDLEILETWKVANADFNASDYDKRTPLHIAASWGYEAIARFLLDSGSNTRSVDAFGNLPIDDAVRNGHLNLVALLEERMDKEIVPNGHVNGQAEKNGID